MANPNWKVTFFFESFQQSDGIGVGASVGWTETWYDGSLNFPSADGILFSDGVNAYIAARRAMLPSIYRVSFVRVSDDANPRNTKLRALQGSYFGQNAGTPAQVTCAVLVDMVGFDNNTPAQAHHRRWLIRGLTVDMIDGNVIANNSPGVQAMSAFLNYLTTNIVAGFQNLLQNPRPRWQLRSLVVKPSINAISAIVPYGLNSNYITILPNPVIPVNLGAKYLVRKVRRPYFCNRVWTDTGVVNVAVPNSITLGRSRRAISGLFEGAGQILPVNPFYMNMVQYAIIGLRLRHIGRPTHQPRGRRNPVT